NELAMLSQPAQLALARLLGQSNQADKALAVYRRLLAGGVMDPGTADIAMEASRLAASQGRTSDAIELVRRALTGHPIPDVRREAEALLHSPERPAPVSAPPVPAGKPSPAVEEEPSVSGVPPELLPDLHQLWAAGRHHDASPSSEIPTVVPPAHVPAPP